MINKGEPMKERTISNKELFREVLRSWRTLLITGLIGLILMNSLLAYRSYKQVQAAKVQYAELENKKMQELKQKEEEEKAKAEEEAKAKEQKGQVFPDPSLSAREITETQVAVEVYKSLRKDYLQTLQYIQNSLYMQINPNAVSRYRMQYLVDNHYTVEYPVIDKKDMTSDILQSYSLRLTNNDMCQKIADTFGLDTETSYIRELISVYGSEDILNIAVIGMDQESCMKIAHILKAELRRCLPEFRATYGTYDLTLVNEEYYISADTDVFSKQLAQFTHLTSTKNTFNGLPSGMTDAQKAYYYDLLDSLYEDSSDAEESVDISSTTVNVEEETAVFVIPKMHLYSIKGSLIGIVLGLFVGCGLVILKRLLSKFLYSEEDVRDSGRILGILYNGPKKRAFGAVDRLIYRKIYKRELSISEEDRFKMVTTGIRIAAEKTGGKDFFVTGTDMSEAAGTLQKRIVNDLKGNLSLSCGRSAIMDPESLEKLSQADGVVLVETIGASNYEEVRRQWNLCQENGIPILGYVLVK